MEKKLAAWTNRVLISSLDGSRRPIRGRYRQTVTEKDGGPAPRFPPTVYTDPVLISSLDGPRRPIKGRYRQTVTENNGGRAPRFPPSADEDSRPI